MAGVNATTVARVINVTVQRISQLSRESGFPEKLGRNEYDLNKITLWYIRHLQAELKRRGPLGTAESANMHAEKLNLVRAQAEKVQTANRVRSGELLEADAVRQVWIRCVANTQKRLRSIPSSTGPQLTNKSDPAFIVDRLKCDIDQALNELASGLDIGVPTSDDGVDGVRATADLYGESMGGREAAAIE